jgi:hypothetical protein
MRPIQSLKWAAVWLALAILAQSARAVPAPAAEAQPALAAIPAQSPIVIQIHGLERTKGRLLTMIKTALPKLAPVVQARIDEGLKGPLEGRQLKGLNPDGPIFLVFTKMPKPTQEEPSVAVYLRVANYKEFLNGFLKEDERKTLKEDPAGYAKVTLDNETAYTLERKGFAIFTNVKETAIELTKSQRGLDSKLSKDDAQRLMNADLGLYVDMLAINHEFGDQIKSAQQMLDGLLQQAAQAQGTVDAHTMEMAKLMFKAVFQLIADGRGLLVTADFKPEGLALTTQFQVRADSPTNDLLKQAKLNGLKELGTLPGGQLAYYGMEIDPGLGKILQPMLLGLVIPPEKQSKALKEALDQINAAGPKRWVTSVGLPIQGLQIGEYTDPAKAVEGQLKLMKALEAGQFFQASVIKGKPEVKVNAQEYRGFKLNSARLVWDFDAIAQQPGGKDAADAMKTLMGEELNSWFGTNGKVYVQIMAKDWPAARRYLEQYLDGKAVVGEQPAFQDARKHLPAQTSLLTMVNVPLYLQAITEVLQPIFKGQGLPIQIPVLKADKTKPTYVGAAVSLQPERGSTELWIPGTAVAEVAKMIEPLLKGVGP